jgi:hypothetical protein
MATPAVNQPFCDKKENVLQRLVLGRKADLLP